MKIGFASLGHLQFSKLVIWYCFILLLCQHSFYIVNFHVGNSGATRGQTILSDFPDRINMFWDDAKDFKLPATREIQIKYRNVMERHSAPFADVKDRLTTTSEHISDSEVVAQPEFFATSKRVKFLDQLERDSSSKGGKLLSLVSSTRPKELDLDGFLEYEKVDISPLECGTYGNLGTFPNGGFINFEERTSNVYHSLRNQFAMKRNMSSCSNSDVDFYDNSEEEQGGYSRISGSNNKYAMEDSFPLYSLSRTVSDLEDDFQNTLQDMSSKIKEISANLRKDVTDSTNGFENKPLDKASKAKETPSNAEKQVKAEIDCSKNNLEDMGLRVEEMMSNIEKTEDKPKTLNETQASINKPTAKKEKQVSDDEKMLPESDSDLIKPTKASILECGFGYPNYGHGMVKTVEEPVAPGTKHSFVQAGFKVDYLNSYDHRQNSDDEEIGWYSNFRTASFPYGKDKVVKIPFDSPLAAIRKEEAGIGFYQSSTLASDEHLKAAKSDASSTKQKQMKKVVSNDLKNGDDQAAPADEGTKMLFTCFEVH